MNLLVSKMVLLASVALATCITAETAYPQEIERAPDRSCRSECAPDVEPVDRRHITTHPNDVRSGNRVIGRDPDRFIRGEVHATIILIKRMKNLGWPD